MSYNPKYFNRKIFWKNLKINKCPIFGCDGNIVKIEKMYECNICTNFKISEKKYLKMKK